MTNDKTKNLRKPIKTISARIDLDVYEYLQEEGIPITNIVKILLNGFVTSDDKLGLLTRCLENDIMIKLDDDEKRLDSFAKERLNTSLWDENFIKLYKDLKGLP